MVSPLSRRTFLVAGSAALLAACSKKKGATVIDAEDDSPSDTAQLSSRLNLVLASFQPLAGADARVAFAVIDGGTNKPLVAEEVDVSFAPDGTTTFGEAITAAVHAEGIEARPYFVVRSDFEKPGRYLMRVRHGERVGEAPVDIADPATSEVPVPGQKLISTPTPTAADARGVNPICTREPACPWHDVSLDEAMGQGKPLVVLFATPALCQSSVCGPVLDILLKEAPALGDRVRFVHVEVFTDMTGKQVAPALQAYKLQNEPFLFLAGADGVVQERLDGPFDRSEARAALQRLTGP